MPLTFEQYCELPSHQRIVLLKRMLKALNKHGVALDGEWTMIRPTEAGWYFVADREGAPRGLRQLIWRTGIDGRRRLCEHNIPTHEPGWQGYFWSEPVQMPPAKGDGPV